MTKCDIITERIQYWAKLIKESSDADANIDMIIKQIEDLGYICELAEENRYFVKFDEIPNNQRNIEDSIDTFEDEISTINKNNPDYNIVIDDKHIEYDVRDIADDEDMHSKYACFITVPIFIN
jgi:hypothetical protein